jgi:hypothetical protein
VFELLGGVPIGLIVFCFVGGIEKGGLGCGGNHIDFF